MPAFPLHCSMRQNKHISVDDWIQAAMERSLVERRQNEIFAYGKQQACKLGIKEEDVETIIHEFRQENAATSK